MVDNKITWGTQDLYKVSDAELKRIVNSTLEKFNAKNLNDHLPEFFNFVKDSLQERIPDADYKILHDVALSVARGVVTMANDQQKKDVMQQNATAQTQQNQTEGMTL